MYGWLYVCMYVEVVFQISINPNTNVLFSPQRSCRSCVCVLRSYVCACICAWVCAPGCNSSWVVGRI